MCGVPFRRGIFVACPVPSLPPVSLPPQKKNGRSNAFAEIGPGEEG